MLKYKEQEKKEALNTLDRQGTQTLTNKGSSRLLGAKKKRGFAMIERKNGIPEQKHFPSRELRRCGVGGGGAEGAGERSWLRDLTIRTSVHKTKQST